MTPEDGDPLEALRRTLGVDFPGVRFYTLADDGVTPIPAPDLLAWGHWMAAHEAERRVAEDCDESADGATAGIRVSTVFLGFDLEFTLNIRDPPVLWETVVFAAGWSFDQRRARYTSAAEALAGHQDICRMVMEAIGR